MRAVAQFAVLVAVYEKYHEKVVITAKWYRVCRKYQKKKRVHERNWKGKDVGKWVLWSARDGELTLGRAEPVGKLARVLY